MSWGNDIRVRISDAAEWLDGKYPDWAEKIDTDVFFMYDPDNCIGGQLGVPWKYLRYGYEQVTGTCAAGLFAGHTAIWLEEIERRVPATVGTW